MRRQLIVNADDFGLTAGVSVGIAEVHVHGIVTSTTAMVRQPGAAEAARLARRHPELDIGLHVDLAEWKYASGEWVALYQRVAAGDADAVAHEVHAQLARFRTLFGRDPTHLDSHQHAHQHSPAREVVAAVGDRLSVPIRGACEVRYVGDFYGQLATGEPRPEAITVASLVGIVRELAEGVSELGCHPGRADGLSATGTMYAAEREVELRTLCAPEVRAALAEANVELTTYAAVA